VTGINHANCKSCSEPTKRITGFWDGTDGWHGKIYSCRNINCEIRKRELELAEKAQANEKLVEETNLKNSIHIDTIKKRRKELRITIAKISKKLSIPCSLYCDYEQLRKPLPIDVNDEINKIFGTEGKSFER